MKKIALVTSLSFASTLMAGTTAQVCPPEPGASCYTTDESICQYCLGPEVVNPSVRPYTCNGDWMITVSALYWTAHQDGMEYAIETGVTAPDLVASNVNPIALNQLIDASYKKPKFEWNWGFRIGLGYNAFCDGWDFGVVWTSFNGTASSHDEHEADDNQTLVTLWSALKPGDDDISILFAHDITTKWRARINLVDIELGREFWTSRYLTLRPFIGLRIASIKQDFDMIFQGGTWGQIGDTKPFAQDPLKGFVELDNNFSGVGPRAGLNTLWHLGRGFSLLGQSALSLIYGRFHVKHDEYTRVAQPPFNKTQVLETKESFKISRFILDLSLGVEWATMFNACKNYFSISLAWEQHLFLSQNQMWRVKNYLADVQGKENPGDNAYFQRRGDLDTEGWTLTLNFGF